jgi:hypothetical protein
MKMNKFSNLLKQWIKDNSARIELQGRETAALRLFASYLDDEALTEEQWRHVYEKRLIERGYIGAGAHESADAAEYDKELDPIEAADEEIEAARYE